jgi:hypothetical protein
VLVVFVMRDPAIRGIAVAASSTYVLTGTGHVALISHSFVGRLNSFVLLSWADYESTWLFADTGM